jgi:hypothetical protein
MSHSARKVNLPVASAPTSKGQPGRDSNARAGGPLLISALKEKVAALVSKDPAKAAKILSLWIAESEKSKGPSLPALPKRKAR